VLPSLRTDDGGSCSPTETNRSAIAITNRKGIIWSLFLTMVAEINTSKAKGM